MAAHVYHEIYLHLTWHTKESLPLITPELEPEVFQFFRDRCVKTKGVYLHGVNGTPTHVHLAMNIEPHVTISDLVRDLKGACSFELNKLHGRKILQWQRGFGVLSFGKQNLDWVLAYVANQKQHHAAGTDLVRMEATELDDELEPESTHQLKLVSDGASAEADDASRKRLQSHKRCREPFHGHFERQFTPHAISFPSSALWPIRRPTCPDT